MRENREKPVKLLEIHNKCFLKRIAVVNILNLSYTWSKDLFQCYFFRIRFLISVESYTSLILHLYLYFTYTYTYT